MIIKYVYGKYFNFIYKRVLEMRNNNCIFFIKQGSVKYVYDIF